MKPTEQNTKTPRTATGLFALLGAFSRVIGTGALKASQGSGASKTSRRLILSVLATTLGALAFTAAPVLAATPETPESGKAEPVTATTAVLHGVLNPGAKGEGGSYQFSYAPSATTCTPGRLAPASPVLAAGSEKEAVETTLTGLEANKQYSFCLIAYGLLGGMAEPSSPSTAVPFKTSPLPPTLGVEKTSGVRATEATLEAEINPNNESTTYVFEYSTTKAGGNLSGAIVKVPVAPPAALEGGSVQTVGAPTEVLVPDTTYFYRVVAENAQSKIEVKPATGPIESFTTALPPEKPVTSSPAKEITATTVKLQGTLNPHSTAKDGWYFAYSNPGGSSCLEGPNTGTEPEVVADAALEEKEVTGLYPHAKYVFCLVAINSAGETTAGTDVPFETLPAPPVLEGESAGVGASEASLNATINANNEKTTYFFEYATSQAEVTAHIATKLPGAPPAGELEGFGGQGVGVSTGAVLSPGTTYFYRVLAENEQSKNEGKTVEGNVESFTTVPAPSTEAPSPLAPTTATFKGTLTPLNAGTPTQYHFIYNRGGECAGRSETPSEEAGTGSAAKAVSAEVSGLLPNTKYTVCLVASNAFGSATSAPVTFTTSVAPLTINSESSSGVDATEARLEAQIYNGNSQAAYRFEYGSAAGSYDAIVPASGGVIPANVSGVSVSAVVTGLTPGRTYHYRVVASNALPGQVDGHDQTFTTPAAQGTGTPGSCANEKLREEQPYALKLPDCRAYEMASPLNTEGQNASDGFDGACVCVR